MGVPKAWLADLRTLVGAVSDRAIVPDKPVVGILSFEAAATMARLVCLYRSLSAPEVQKLRLDTMRSQGVAYLNSTDQFFLLCLACAEFMTELDRAATAVARMGLKCTAEIPRGFDRLYNELKACCLSGPELERLGFGSNAKAVEKKIKKMERYVATTSKLYQELELLNELEAKEHKAIGEQQQWRRHSGPIPMQKPADIEAAAAALDPLQVQLRAQTHKMKRLKDDSLWNKTYDKAVELMARAVVTVFGRICSVFSPAVPGLPDKNQRNTKAKSNHLNFPGKHSSGPLERPITKDMAILRNSAPIYVAKAAITNTLLGKWSKLLEAPPNSVGAMGLALRYANVIVMAESLVRGELEDDEEGGAREELYRMIPVAMRASLRAKLSECWRAERQTVAFDGSQADGWKEAAERILRWLAPVAHDTLRWQEERNMDRKQRFDSQPRAVLLQTLHFSDAVKTEAAIVEVLVALSCMRWYAEGRR